MRDEYLSRSLEAAGYRYITEVSTRDVTPQRANDETFMVRRFEMWFGQELVLGKVMVPKAQNYFSGTLVCWLVGEGDKLSKPLTWDTPVDASEPYIGLRCINLYGDD